MGRQPPTQGHSNTLAALRSIRAARPDGAPVYVILDNLSAHNGKKIRRWAENNNVHLCFTPTNASWANPIEAHFGPLEAVHAGELESPEPHGSDPRAALLPAVAQRLTPATPTS